MGHSAEEERILAWLKTPSTPAHEETPRVAATGARSQPAVVVDEATRAERDRQLRSQTRRLRASALTQHIRARSPRMSSARAAENATAWSAIVADAEHLDEWLAAGLRVTDHAIAARCVAQRISPARLRPLMQHAEQAARLRSGADPRELLEPDQA